MGLGMRLAGDRRLMAAVDDDDGGSRRPTCSVERGLPSDEPGAEFGALPEPLALALALTAEKNACEKSV